MRPPGSPVELERRRRRAMQLLREGLPPVEVARMVGVDRRSVRRWNAAHRERGLSGLKAKPAPGRPAQVRAQARVAARGLGARAAPAVPPFSRSFSSTAHRAAAASTNIPITTSKPAPLMCSRSYRRS